MSYRTVTRNRVARVLLHPGCERTVHVHVGDQMKVQMKSEGVNFLVRDFGVGDMMQVLVCNG